MSVRGTLRLEGVDKMDATVTLTMTVAEWKELRKLLEPSGGYVRHQVTDLIDRLVSKASQSFFDIEDKEDAAQ